MSGAAPPPDRPRRREVLEALRAADGPLGVADVARRLGVHANTARFHLDALAAEGAVERSVEEPSGRGRPRTVYAPRPGMDRGGARGYRLLAQILLSRLASAGPGARADATRAGREWGRYLVDRPPPFRPTSEADAAGRLTALLADLDFDPKPAADVIRLRHCPFLELAEEYGPLVCDVHLGLMQGALEELDAPLAADRLEPFAEPGACVAHLRRAPR
ncbi:helix-turn-helix transcriptional regulator [Actinomadura chibensis]|uniref:Helix-turn-helix domain-containing protein n=1 Tax=Actinomadura chibensis TaxID=392828 RepID=A0A5D0NAR7_9ACTN|nr:helix-turn-helix domain-containing protein [Actinomadura chibensis]TYB41540.1 helix-turn-helix domain-containing protein [Actinomadura chibensis]